MDDDDRDESGSENEQDELMEDADDMEPENDAEEEDNEEEEEDDQEGDDPEPDHDADPEAEADGDPEPTESFDDSRVKVKTQDDETEDQVKRPSTAPDSPTTPRWRPKIPPEYLTARTYDIVPTMAAPQSTSINALAITPDLRFWVTGGSDGYIRKYDGVGTVNGKQLLTVAQRHPFVDSVTKAGILMSYWENEEPSPPNARVEEHVLSPVYSLAIHSQGLWLLSGLESGGINLQSVRHDEGKRIHCLQGGHTNAVSMLLLSPDEKSVLSGSWDKGILDWDLNTGQIIRRFDGKGGQISALELRPASGAPIPAAASEVLVKSETIATNNDQPIFGSSFTDATDGAANGAPAAENGAAPGPSPEHESLFGSPAGSLFGDNDAMGGNAFGGDDDDEFSRAMEMTLNDNDEPTQANADHSGDFTMPDAAPNPTDFPDSAATKPIELSGVEDANADSAPGNVDGTAAAADIDLLAAPTDSQLASAPDQQFDTQPATADITLPDASQMDAEPSSPSILFSSTAPAPHHDQTQASASTFLSASIDGTIRIWDRRVANPVARINNRPGVPPWCAGACWSPDGNWIYAGRRNGTVEEFDIRNAWSNWGPERTLKFPGGSGAVSCVRPMPNGRHLVCASHDILRLYDLHDHTPTKASKVPFLIIPGPPRPGVIASLYIDPTSRFMVSIAGTRGWEGSSTETLVGYEINVPE